MQSFFFAFIKGIAVAFEISDFDFIDCGASTGGSTDFAMKKLGGKRGLGVNLNPKRVQFMQSKGFDCIEGDITKLPFADDSVRFTVLSHILEHLPDQETVVTAIQEAIRVSKDFVFIQGPFYEADLWLAQNNLKFFWSDLRGHLYPVKAQDIVGAVKNLGLPEPKIYGRAPIQSTSDKTLHSMQSPFNSLYYDSQIHPPKPEMKFDVPLFKEIVTIVPTRLKSKAPSMGSVFKDIAPWNFDSKIFGLLRHKERQDKFYRV